MSGSFQTFTNVLQAPGIAGDFATKNPRATALSSQQYGNAGFVAGPNGLQIGAFAWLDTATYRIASNYGAGIPTGFVHRNLGGLITVYLNAYGMVIPAGMMVGNIFIDGDFFVLNSGTTEATPGMKAYANNGTGLVSFAATASPTASGVSASTATIAPETASSATSTITDNVFTTGSAVTNLFVPGGILSGTGVASGTQIVAQLTGTAGGVGTYEVAPRGQTVASTTISETYGLFAPGTLVSGSFTVGQTLSGSGVTAGTFISAPSATTGDWIVSPTQTAGSETITGYSNTETSWYCRSFAQPGEVAKMSSISRG